MFLLRIDREKWLHEILRIALLYELSALAE